MGRGGRESYKTNTVSKNETNVFGIRYNVQGPLPKSVIPSHIYSQHKQSKSFLKESIKYIFEPDQWIHFFKLFDRSTLHKRHLRLLVQIGTLDACCRCKYIIKEEDEEDAEVEKAEQYPVINNEEEKKIKFRNVSFDKKRMEKSIRNTVMYQSDHKYKDKPNTNTNSKENIDTKILIVHGDCLETALWVKHNSSLALQIAGSQSQKNSDEITDKKKDTNKNDEDEDEDEGEDADADKNTDENADVKEDKEVKNIKLKVAMLDMSSASNPCGGYKKGSASQEENIARRTALFHYLDDPFGIHQDRSWSYPIPEFGGIYCPNVVVLRNSERNGYSFLENPDYISMVCVAAYKDPPTEPISTSSSSNLNVDSKPLRKLSGKILQHTKRKMQTIFNIAIENGIDCLVLSAFGCGVYGNPPNHIASLFKELLEKEFKNCFKLVVFSIIDQNEVTAFQSSKDEEEPAQQNRRNSFDRGNQHNQKQKEKEESNDEDEDEDGEDDGDDDEDANEEETDKVNRSNRISNLKSFENVFKIESIEINNL